MYVESLAPGERQSDGVRALAESDSVAKPLSDESDSVAKPLSQLSSLHHHSDWQAGWNKGASDMTLNPGGIKCLILPLNKHNLFKYILKVDL